MPSVLPTPGPSVGRGYWPRPSPAVARLSEVEFFRRWREIDDLQTRREALRLRFRYRVGEFGRFAFPDICYLPFNAFHRDLLLRPKVAYQRRTENAFRAYAAPRGIAKTTLTKVDVAHDIVFALEAFVVVLSATHPDATSWIATLLSWFSNENSPLWELFGPFEISGNERDGYAITVREDHTTALLSKGWGSSVRGANVNTVRPTRVIMDDAENAHRVDNPRIRGDWQVFLNTDVAFLPRKEGGANFDFVGTVLHPDAILSRILDSREGNSGWRSRRYKAVLSWPANAKLWEEARAIFVDLERGDPEVRKAAARAFYEENRAAMDEGSVVLDPAGLPLFEVYVHIWSKGWSAALRDLQNEASDPTRRIFDVEKFKRCKFDGVTITNANGREVRLRDCDVAVHLDPIPAERFGSDFAALAVVARDARGYRYVLRVTMIKGSPLRQRALMWSAFEEFGSRATYTYEDNGFAALFGEGFEREKEDRLKETPPRLAGLDPEGVTSTENKVRRIAALEPDALNGWLQFADDLDVEVMGQFRDFPTGANDDGPDAVERADKALNDMPTIVRSGWTT